MLTAKFGVGLLPQQSNVCILYSVKHEKKFYNILHMYGKVMMAWHGLI